MLTPFPHQQTMIDEARQASLTNKAVLLQSPTGSGKTTIGTLIASGAAAKNRRVMFTVHRDFLIEQTAKTFDDARLPYGVIAPGYSGDPHALAQIASIDTLKHRLDKVRRPDLLIIDECHHAIAAGWAKVLEQYLAGGTKVIGLTATPWRLSGEGLGRYFSYMVKGPSVRWLIENNFLCDYRAYAPFTPDMSAIHSRHGDYIRSEVEAVVDRPTLTGDAISHYQKFADGKRGIAFCVSIKHSEHVAASFLATGIPAAHLDGTTPKEERKRTIAAFRRGDIQVLTSVDIFGEGFDIPAVEVALLLRPTQSLSLHLQQVGRALRVFDGKAGAIILDHAGNLMRLGLPDSEVEWSLDGLKKRKKKASESSLAVRQCEKCYAVFPPAPICPECGHEQPKTDREVEQREGELQEITREMARQLALDKKKEVQRARTVEALESIEKARGYSPGWAKMIHEIRERSARERAEQQAQAYLRAA